MADLCRTNGTSRRLPLEGEDGGMEPSGDAAVKQTEDRNCRLEALAPWHGDATDRNAAHGCRWRQAVGVRYRTQPMNCDLRLCNDTFFEIELMTSTTGQFIRDFRTVGTLRANLMRTPRPRGSS